MPQILPLCFFWLLMQYLCPLLKHWLHYLELLSEHLLNYSIASMWRAFLVKTRSLSMQGRRGGDFTFVWERPHACFCFCFLSSEKPMSQESYILITHMWLKLLKHSITRNLISQNVDGNTKLSICIRQKMVEKQQWTRLLLKCVSVYAGWPRICA